MTTERIRVGVIGAGFAGRVHLEGYSVLPQVDIVALAALEDDRRQALGERFHIPNLLTTHEELFARDDLDAVSICTPNHLHAPLALIALEKGMHVLAEKPMASSAADALQLVDTARKCRRVLHVAFNHRERGDVQVLKRAIDDGVLGRIYHAKASWMRRRGIPRLGSWYTSKQMAGGGPLIDLGVHVLDMALYLMGEPQATAASAATYAELGPRGRGDAGSDKFAVGSPYEVEDLATAFIRLDNEATLLLEASWATHGSAGDDFGVTLYGTEGGAELRVRNYSWEDTLRIFTDVAGAAADVRPRLTPGEAHVAVVRAFVNAIESGHPELHCGDAGLARTLIIDACYRSAAEHRELAIEMPERLTDQRLPAH